MDKKLEFDKTKYFQVGVRLDEKTYNTIKHIADKEKISISEVIRSIIRYWGTLG